MVTVVATMARCQGVSLCCIFFQDEPPPTATLGILAFDAAKTMCRLVTLYKSLTDVEIRKLRRQVIKSKGVAHLNSQDECFLLNLACAERLEDLNLAAATVSRLGQSCSDMGLSRFDLVYADLKLGIIDIRKLEFGTQNIQKIIEKMEKLISATRNLHCAMESLAEMEASEKKMQRWKTMRANQCLKVKVECYHKKIMFHRKQVQYYKHVSLWNQTFDKAVGLMARIVCIIYARIYSVFRASVTGMPCCNKDDIRCDFFLPNFENCSCLLEHRVLYRTNCCLFNQNEESVQKHSRKSGHNPKTTRTGVIRFPNHHHPFPPKIAANHGGRVGCCGSEVAKNNQVFRLAPPSTVGGAGLSLRYANVILFAERCMEAPATIGEDAREALYDMLPERLKTKVRTKLKSQWLKWEERLREGDDGHSMAEEWQDTVEDLMEWLLPVAHDTLRWQAERNLERQKLDTKPTVLLLQTLHYSNLEKAEAVIVEMLAGISCVYWYQKQ